MIYEIRFYEVAAGQMAEELRRMAILAYGGEPDADGRTPGYETSCMALYKVPPMVGVWSARAGQGLGRFFYMCRYEDIAERDRVWTRFWNSPELAATIAATTKTKAQVVEHTFPVMMRPNPAWASVRRQFPSSGPVGGVHELWLDRIAFGEGARAHRLLGEIDLPFLCRRGATVLGSFDVWIGPDIPTTMTFLAWPDDATRQAGLAALDRDAASLAARRDAQAACKGLLIEKRESFLMAPAPYAIPLANFGEPA